MENPKRRGCSGKTDVESAAPHLTVIESLPIPIPSMAQGWIVERKVDRQSDRAMDANITLYT